MSERRSRVWIFFLVLFVLAAGAFALQSWRLDAAERRHAEEIAAKQRLVLEAGEWAKSEAADRARMASTVAGLELQLAAAREAKAKPLIVTRTVTGEATWTPPPGIICPEPDAGAAVAKADASPLPPSAAPASSVPEIGVRARVETAIVATETGEPYVATAVWATPRIGRWVGEERLLPEGEVTVQHDPEIERAIRVSRERVRRLDLHVLVGTDPNAGYLLAGVGGGGKRLGWTALAGLRRAWDAPAGDGYGSALGRTDPVVLVGARLSLR